MTTTDSPRFQSSSPARCMFFSIVIQFWQILQNDLIMEKTQIYQLLSVND